MFTIYIDIRHSQRYMTLKVYNTQDEWHLIAMRGDGDC